MSPLRKVILFHIAAIITLCPASSDPIPPWGCIINDLTPGLWQTWGGVNNTDALMVNNHILGTTPLAINPPVIRPTASVKFPHPAIQNNDYLAIRQTAKFGWGYFDIPKWMFSGIDASTRIDTFQMTCANETRDGVLYIGWMSTSPVRMENEGILLLIHAGLTEVFQASIAHCPLPIA